MQTFTRDGLVFDVTDSGPADGPVAVLLHGFPQDRTSWNHVTPALNEAGIRTVAVDQRGYSPGANPRARSAYVPGELVRDTLAAIDATGAEQVHLVGHDWGAAIAWMTALAAPGRLASLTTVSTPHPSAMEWAIRHADQGRKSLYMLAFNVPWIPEHRLAGRVGNLLRGTGAPEQDAQRYADRFTTPESLHGPLNWYRGMLWARLPRLRRPGSSSAASSSGKTPRDPRVSVPTTYIWGREDFALGAAAARKTREFVSGPYEFVEVDGGHWLPETHPHTIIDAVLEACRGRSGDTPPGPRA